MTKLCFLLVVCAICLVNYSECTVSVRSISPAALGTNVVIYCDIVGESNVPAAIFWSRQNYDGSGLVNYISASILPTNYATANSQQNSTYYISTLTITGVTTSDYATFICMSKSSRNLTQAAATINPLTLCKNGSYNHVVYAFLLTTNLVLVALMIFVLRCLMQLSTANLAVAFGCILGAILFSVLMVIFWISPIFAAPYDGDSYIYWSPIVIVPASVVASFILWGGLLFYIIKSFIANKKDTKNIVSLVVFSCIALIQLILVLVIICSVVYCTGQSTLPSSTDYSAASVTCAVLNFVAIIALCAYVFWMFKDSFKSIGILNRAETKYSARDQPANEKKNAKKVETKVESITDRPDTGRSTTSAFNTSAANTDDEGDGKKGKKGKKAKDADASGAESAAEGGKKKGKGKKAKDDAAASETEGAGEKKKKGKKGKKGGD